MACTSSVPVSAQLVLRLSIDFPMFDPGDQFLTTPYPLANSDYCLITGDQPVDGQQVQCGEVDTESEFGFQLLSQYTASVSATVFSKGTHTIGWTPTVACVRVDGDGEVISGGSGPFCQQNITATGQGIFWDLGGSVSIPSTAVSGSYSATVTLSISGPGLQASISVPASLDISTMQTICSVSTAGGLDLGKALAQTQGSITVSPVTGLRTFGGSQSDPFNSSFTMEQASVTTDADQVTISVQAPQQLQRSSGSIVYKHYTAYRLASGQFYTLALTGSGTHTVTLSSNHDLQFRFGGQVTTTMAATAGTYTGTATVSFQCH